MQVTRRNFLIAGSAGSAVLAGGAFPATSAAAQDDGMEIVEEIIDAPVTESGRLHLELPPEFPNGATVPLSLHIDTVMTAEDHVRGVRLFAPRNPVAEIMGFHFEQAYSIPHVSTRIRLAGPQFVVAVAEMNDGSLLMAKRFVDVATNGCVTQ